MEFIKKWGLLIIIFFNIIIFFSTCGTKSKIDKLEKKVFLLEKNIHVSDSLNKIKNDINLEIYNLKSERSILFNMNEIVLKNVRPSQKIDQITKDIDKLEKQLKDVK